MSCFLDTSALAKWYVREDGSEAFEHFMLNLEPGHAWISPLTITEMRSLLARHRRMRTFDADYELAAWETFLHDVSSGVLRVISLEERQYTLAAELIAQLTGHALRTLDALHLATARTHGAQSLASADRIMLQACEELGMQPIAF